MKVHRNISLEEEVDNDIKQRVRHYGFNFSEWVENEYIDKLMGLKAKEKQLKMLEKRLKSLKNDLKLMETKEETFKISLSRSEKRLLLEIPRLISEGKEWDKLLIRFNMAFNKEFSLLQFKKAVKFLQDEAQRNKR